MEKLRNIYAELFAIIQRAAVLEKEECASFTAMQGFRYATAKDITGKAFRMMLVGRAVNGWKEYTGKDGSKEEFVNAYLANLTNQPQVLKYGKDRFEWIATDERGVTNLGVEDDKTVIDNPYNLLRSRFWCDTKEIWENLYGRRTDWNERWFENICWSNLYKISPRLGGNPSAKLQNLQENICIKLLQEEIEYFQPTHILFLTGSDWFMPFGKIFNNVIFIGCNKVSGKNKNDIFVEATAEYITRTGSVCKIVVACRPEMRAKDGYVEQVSKYLRR